MPIKPWFAIAASPQTPGEPGALGDVTVFRRLGRRLAARAVPDGRAIALTALLFASTSHAGLVSGFEQGLTGWDYIGDVSIQTSDIGTTPTQAQHMAFLTTMCDRDNPPSEGECQITTNEHPYSGVSSPPSWVARDFLGLGQPWDDPGAWPQWMPEADNVEERIWGEGGAMKISFFAPRAGVVSFDWNLVGDYGDLAYVSVWTEDPEGAYRVADWINPDYHLTMVPSDVQLCARYYDDPAEIEPICGSFGLNTESGWHTKSLAVPEAGWYWVGFAIGEVAEGTVPSVLALDNVRFQVPEPGTMGLIGLGLAGLAVVRRRKP